MISPVYQDSLYFPRPADSIRISRPQLKSDSVILALPREIRSKKPATERKPLEILTEPVTPVQEKEIVTEKWNSSSDFFIENGLKGIVSSKSKTNNKTETYISDQRPANLNPVQRDSFTYDWLLGIFLFLVVLFVWIRIFYNKFFSALANALISFQLSVKLFQERNVLLRRVSIVLDFIYIIVAAVFIFELIEYTGFAGTGMSGFNLFLLLFNILMLYSVLRIITLRIIGSLFLVTPLFSEYIHNTFVVNKGVGILLFPIVIMSHYMPYKLIPVILVVGVILVSVALLYKSFRAYQIIIRRDVLIFYLILYLCTLEILPLLLGYKFVTSLIQSN